MSDTDENNTQDYLPAEVSDSFGFALENDKTRFHTAPVAARLKVAQTKFVHAKAKGADHAQHASTTHLLL